MSKPVIGINADFRRAQGNQPAFTYVAAGYYDCVFAAGGVPVILPPLEDEADIDLMLERLDGVVMIGGADLDPRRDGFMLHPTVRPMESRREFHVGVSFRGIVFRRRFDPFFAIACRVMAVLRSLIGRASPPGLLSSGADWISKDDCRCFRGKTS